MTDDLFGAHPQFRQVQHLAKLREAGGWRFHIQPALITGVRAWPDGSADVIAVEQFTTARGRRTNPVGAVVWRYGPADLTEVVDRLVALPAPGQPDAPVEVLGGGPGLWTS